MKTLIQVLSGLMLVALIVAAPIIKNRDDSNKNNELCEERTLDNDADSGVPEMDIYYMNGRCE